MLLSQQALPSLDLRMALSDGVVWYVLLAVLPDAFIGIADALGPQQPVPLKAPSIKGTQLTSALDKLLLG